MAKDISRKKLKRVLSDIDNCVYNNPQVFSQHSGVYKVLNKTGKVIPKGGIVRLSGFKGMPDYETSLKQALSGNIIFGSTTSSENTFYATAKETIPINSIGIIETDNIYVARTRINHSSHVKASVVNEQTYQFSTSLDGTLLIVAKGPVINDGGYRYAICALKSGVTFVARVESSGKILYLNVE
jgi:hypothetical protein